MRRRTAVEVRAQAYVQASLPRMRRDTEALRVARGSAFRRCVPTRPPSSRAVWARRGPGSAFRQSRKPRPACGVRKWAHDNRRAVRIVEALRLLQQMRQAPHHVVPWMRLSDRVPAGAPRRVARRRARQGATALHGLLHEVPVGRPPASNIGPAPPDAPLAPRRALARHFRGLAHRSRDRSRDRPRACHFRAPFLGVGLWPCVGGGGAFALKHNNRAKCDGQFAASEAPAPRSPQPRAQGRSRTGSCKGASERPPRECARCPARRCAGEPARWGRGRSAAACARIWRDVQEAEPRDHGRHAPPPTP